MGGGAQSAPLCNFKNIETCRVNSTTWNLRHDIFTVAILDFSISPKSQKAVHLDPRITKTNKEVLQ